MTSPLNRALQRTARFVGGRIWGVEALILPMIVENFGAVGAVRWFARNLPPYERALRDLGGMRTNLICSAASLFNGCAYCTYACSRAFELCYFEEYDRLFPLDEHAFIGLISLTDDEARAKLDAALREASLADEVSVLARLYAIKLEGAAPRPDEAFLVHAIQMFDDLNFCSTEAQLPTDEAHDRINKNVALKARYARARLAAGRNA